MKDTSKQVPVQITFRNVRNLPSITELIRKRARALEKFCSRITDCRVVIEKPHQHHRRGNQFLIRIDLTVPGQDIVVNREASEHNAYKSVQIAIRDGFDTARRLLEEYVRDRRDVRHARLLPAQ